jgi:hypothetical protein
MGSTVTAWLWLAAVWLLFLAAPATLAVTEELGNGFRHHGVATPISNHRGTVATVDGQGHDVVLSWLMDHRGGYELLLVDVETGKAEEYPLPFPVGDSPFASILSSGNKFYTHFNSDFVEFDPVQRAFTFSQKTAPQMAMSMTEDDRGVIWSATYPQSGIVSFDPKTRAFHDYGQVYHQNWAQYPRSVAADDAGWIYFGVGSTLGQILTFDPTTGKATPVVPEEQRTHGYASVYRDVDGKVYGQPAGDRQDNGLMLYKGRVTRIGTHEKARAKAIITGSQGLFHRDFPDGKRVRTFDLVARTLIVEDPKAGTSKTIRFDYRSEGAHIMGLAAAPDGTICGGTSFPMRFFRYDPAQDAWTNHAAYGQFNTVGRQGDRFFTGGYGGGFLLEWDPARPWVPTERGSKASNPRFLIQVSPTIHRPHRLLAHPDGKTLVMGGTPDYGYTGGGLLFWDRETEKSVLLTDKEVMPDQSTMALVPLSGGKLLGGTTTSPGTGGEKKAKEAELYLLDVATKRLEWHQPIFPAAQSYTDLTPAPNGLVYGFADRTRFFVVDPTQRKVVHEQDTGAALGPTASQQGPRVFIPGPKGETYVLFVKGIARVDPRTYQITLLAPSPVPADCGGDILNGRLYFASGSHVYSYKLPE